MINCSRLLSASNAQKALPSLRYMPAKAPIVFWFAAGYPGAAGEGCGTGVAEGVEGGAGVTVDSDSMAMPGAMPEDALSHEEAESFIDDLAGMGVPMMTVEGDDLRPRTDLFDLVGKAARKGLRVVLATGHHWIDQQAARWIKDAGVAYVGLNLDLPGKGRRLLDCFRHCLPAVAALQEAGLPFGIKVSFAEFDRDEMAALFGAMMAAGVRRVALYQDVAAGCDWDVVRQDRRGLMDFLLERVVAKGGEAGLEVVTEDNYADGPYTYIWARSKGMEGATEVRRLLQMQGGCGAGRKIVGVSASGEVHPCPSWWHLSVGNVRETPLSAIWESDGNGLFRALRERKGHLKGRCGVCGFQAICGGCRVRAYRATGDHFEGDPACYIGLAAVGVSGANGEGMATGIGG